MSSTEQTPPQDAEVEAQNNKDRRGRGGRGRGPRSGRGPRGHGRKPAATTEPKASSGAAAADADGPMCVTGELPAFPALGRRCVARNNAHGLERAPVRVGMEVRKVAGTSDVRGVAGAIAHNVRDGSAPTLMAMGPRSVNQAVKAIAVARSYLAEEGHELQCQPEFVHVEMEDTNEKRSGLHLVLKREEVGGDDASTTLVGDELKVAASSVPTTLAGAIAKRVRSDDSVSIVAIGANSVNQALKSIAIARKYLVDDGKDVQFRPGFVHVTLENDDRTAVKFQLSTV